MQEPKIAVLGLGLIGSIWARHYATAGQLATAWSRSPKPDLPFYQDSLERCAEQAQWLQLCLYDANSVRTVLERLLPHLNDRHTVIQSSTIDGDSAAEFEQQVTARGARYLESPFTGSKPAAEAKQTVFFLGGEAALMDEAEGFLKTISSNRFRIGAPAQAASIKLAMNLQIASIAEALCESLTMARGAGIPDATFFEVMKKNVAWSGLAALKEDKLVQADYTPQFSIKNMHKDMRLARASAKSSLPMLDTIRQCLEDTERAGFGEDDFISLIRIL